jgi:hypothetical protein
MRCVHTLPIGAPASEERETEARGRVQFQDDTHSVAHHEEMTDVGADVKGVGEIE